jgi:hypothetical protein
MVRLHHLPTPKHWLKHRFKIRVVDPDPDWIRIQRLVWIRIRIGNPDPGARKLRNFSGKMHFLIIF